MLVEVLNMYSEIVDSGMKVVDQLRIKEFYMFQNGEFQLNGSPMANTKDVH